MIRSGRWFLAFSGLIMIWVTAVACGDSDDPRVVTASQAAFVPVIESSDVFVGMPRLVVTLLERDSQPVFADGAGFLIRYFDPTEGGIKFHSEAELTEIDVEGFRYLIANNPPFQAAGQWAIAIAVELPDGTAESTPRLPFLVRGSANGLSRDVAAPTVETPIIADGILEKMTSTPDEVLTMYERSASELIASGEPFLIVWASANRCAGRLACARALEQATTVLSRGDIAVLHVEPFGRPRTGALQALIDTAIESWSIEAEPQLFLIDEHGLIAQRFEIVVDQAELDVAIEALTR
jgi:hypothetical protein